MPNAQVAVLGGTGFVGRALLSPCASWQTRPRVLVHRSRPEWLTGVDADIVEVDLESDDSVSTALAGCGTMINLLRPDGTGWYPALMRGLASRIARAGVRRVVQTSSIDVYGGSTARLVDADTAAVPRTAYETEHVAVEGMMLAAVPRSVVLRLGAVFGPGGRNLLSIAGEMQAAQRFKPALRRALYGRRRMHLVSVGTVCDALLFFAKSEHEGRLVVTEDAFEDNNFAYAQDTLARSFGRAPLTGVPALPPAVLETMLRLRGQSANAPRRRFSAAGLEATGFRTRDFPTELEAYARHLAAAGQRGGP